MGIHILVSVPKDTLLNYFERGDEKHNVDSFMIIGAFSRLNIMYVHVEQR